METKLRETSRILMKALEGWYPFLKGIEDTIGILEGDLEHLTARKKALGDEIAEQLKNAAAAANMDKEKAAKLLSEAELLLKKANEIFLELYKAKASRIVPPESYSESVLAKGKEIESKSKKLKEEIRA